MADARPNIVQAEFFLPKNLRKGDLDALVDEMLERKDEGSPIKLSVRFYDEDGAITRFVQEAEKETKWYRDELMTGPVQGTLITRWWQRIQSRKHARNRVANQTNGLSLAVEKLTAAVKGVRQVGIEDHYSGPIRPAEKAELHELLESVRSATGVWFFVFKPNDLFSDHNVTVGSYM